MPESSPSNIGSRDSQESIAVHVTRRDDTVVVTVSGEIDLGTASVLSAALDQLAPDQDVVVDCAAVEFIDSTGLHLIVTQSQRMSDAGGSLRLRHTSFPVRHVVEITGLIQLFETDE